MATAKYWRDKLINYKYDNHKLCKCISRDYIFIHHKNDEKHYYMINKYDKEAIRYSMNDNDEIHYIIDELDGKDFELFNTAQIILSGYIVLKKCKSKDELNKKMTDIYHHINKFAFYDCAISDRYSFISEYSYLPKDNMDMEVKIRIIDELCKENKDRKYYKVRCIPFLRSIKNSEAFYVSISVGMCHKNYKKQLNSANKALTQLLNYIRKDLGINCKFIKVNIDKPIYY